LRAATELGNADSLAIAACHSRHVLVEGSVRLPLARQAWGTLLRPKIAAVSRRPLAAPSAKFACLTSSPAATPQSQMDRYEDAKLRIKEATDIVALIESYLPLKPRGRVLVALCPFHAENSPSFTVDRERQHFKCYGCQKYGDVFTWLMERDGLTFKEAMQELADRAGISLEGVFGQGGPKAPVGQSPHEVLAAVAGFCQRALLHPDEGRLARAYLEQRGLGDAIGPWRLGYHPAPGALARFAQQQQLPRDVLEAANLLRNGREMFAHRLMFPIEDERGRVVGFGGRILPGAPGSEGDGDFTPPKYYNSPESPFFNKRRVLFGLHRAKQAGNRRLVVMEGYTDVIACHLAGFSGAVASLGTAFTADHARVVERYATEGLILMFDGDRAGVQAAERSVRELVNSRLQVRIAMMGDADGTAKDPADVVVQRPGEDMERVTERRARFADVLDGADDYVAVWFRLLRRRLDLSQAVHVETAAHECAALLARVESPVRQSALLDQMARHLAVPTPRLQRLLDKLARPARAGTASSSTGPAEAGAPPPRPPTPLDESEFEVLACICAEPGLSASIDASAAATLSPDVATLVAWAVEGVALGRTAGDALVRYLMARAAEQPNLQRRLVDASERSRKLRNARVVLAGHLAGRRRLTGEGQRRIWRQQLQEALAVGDQPRAAELQRLLLTQLREERPRNQTI
jgi:DNA primase